MSFLSDHLPKRLDFEKNFNVCIPDKEIWRKGGPKLGALVWYTDGSVKEGKAGAGVVGPNCKRTLAMVQTEIHAIEIAALENIKNNPKGKRIYIISDSQAALKAIMSYTIKSGLVWNCLERLKELARGNKLTLMWTPGHEGIEGNEMADTLARKGSEMMLIGPEPYCSISGSAIRNVVNSWEQKEKETYWTLKPGMKQSKLFIKISEEKAKFYLNLTRNELRMITGLLTGHCPLKYHLKKMRLVEDSTCRLCMEDEEKAQLILCECEALAFRRLQYLGQDRMEPEDISRINPKELLNFIRSIGFIWDI
ncbi:uncharacterized protein [Halyomorpha halys]|uniref:uncharacterized protein n=1 Tax=Halyomorpha halys TaxID=286706 RepID=UPI0034D36BB0